MMGNPVNESIMEILSGVNSIWNPVSEANREKPVNSVQEWIKPATNHHRIYCFTNFPRLWFFPSIRWMKYTPGKRGETSMIDSALAEPIEN